MEIAGLIQAFILSGRDRDGFSSANQIGKKKASWEEAMIELGEALGPPTHAYTLRCTLQAGPNPKPPTPQNEHCM